MKGKMPKGFYGDPDRHRMAGKQSTGNRTRGSARKGGRKAGQAKKEEDQETK